MTVFEILMYLIVIGVAMYVVNAIIPMDPSIKKLANVVVILAVCVWLLENFGVLAPLHFGRQR